MFRARRNSRMIPWILAALAQGLAGCAALTPIEGIPANRLPSVLQEERKADLQTIDFIRLRQDPPPVYLLGTRDILGIFIEGVLGSSEEAPPVHFPDKGNIPPALGYPIPIREDGTIALPLVPPIKVAGLSLVEAEGRIRRAYTVDQRILQPGKDRIIVTLMRPRTYEVMVVREEAGGVVNGSTSAKRGTGYNLDLKAYENDVLHALTETGGLPGVDAKNEVVIYRGRFADAEARDRLLQTLNQSCDPCAHFPPPAPNDPNVTRIPIRFGPGEEPHFRQEDIILHSGDIVVIESRAREVFYTGGVLAGGEHPIPRDYDLDVLGAIAISGGSIAGVSGHGGSTFGGGGGSLGALPPSEIIVVRNLPGGGAIPIKTSLNRAIVDPRSRILIQPGDIVILRYTPQEQIINAFLSVFQFNYFLNSGFNK